MKKLSFRYWSLFTKNFSIVIAAFVLTAIVIFAIIKPKVYSSVLSERKNNVKNLVNSTSEIVKFYYSLAMENKISVDEAQKTALQAISKIRYDGNNYFFVMDLQGRLIMHPIKPQLVGKDMIGFKDKKGNYLFRDMVNVAKTKGAGFVSYYWPKPGFEEPVPKISFVKLIKGWNWIVCTGVYSDEVSAIVNSIISNVVYYLLLALLIVFIIAYLISKRISKSINKIVIAANKIEQGESARVKIKSKAEVGKLAAAFNSMVERLEKNITAVKEKEAEANKAKFEAEESKKEVEKQHHYLSENMEKLMIALQKLSEGDLNVKIEVEDDGGEIAKVQKAFNITVEKIRDLIGSLTKAIQITASTSTQISSSAEEMAAGAQEQSSQTAEVASAVEEMTKTIMETAANSEKAAQAAQESREFAKEGVKKVRNTQEGMDEIFNKSRQIESVIAKLEEKAQLIGEITQIIDEIADQTNLLSLNAAIEAARAGEHGRGFSVVAAEVRKLAERTTKATKEISDTIKSIQTEAQNATVSMEAVSEAVNMGTKLTNEIGETFTGLLESVQKVTNEIEQVAAASEEQSSTAEQISRNIEAINNVANETAGGIQEIARAINEFNDLTDKLNRIAAQFRIKENKSEKVSFGTVANF